MLVAAAFVSHAEGAHAAQLGDWGLRPNLLITH